MRLNLLLALLTCLASVSATPANPPINTLEIGKLITWTDRGWHDARINLATKRVQPIVGRSFESIGPLSAIVQGDKKYVAIMNYEIDGGALDGMVFIASFDKGMEEYLAEFPVAARVKLRGTIESAHCERRTLGNNSAAVVIVVTLKDSTIAKPEK